MKQPTKAAKVMTIEGSEIAAACGFAIPKGHCQSCGGCGWFTSVGPDRPCECNPDRASVERCFARARWDEETRQHKLYPELTAKPWGPRP